MDKNRNRNIWWIREVYDSFCSFLKKLKCPKFIIQCNWFLYIFTIFLFFVGVYRLTLHWRGYSVVSPLSLIIRTALILALILIVILVSTKNLWCITLVIVGIVLFDIFALQPGFFHDKLLNIYQAVSDWCFYYAKSEAISEIFVAMGIINFSFSYVITARDKQFYGVPLNSVIQEQFPKHGQTFLFYTCLTLVGLYASGMDYSIVALICLVGAFLAFGSTCIVAFLFTFSHQGKQDMVEYYLSSSSRPIIGYSPKSKQDTCFSRTLAAADYIHTYYKTNGTIPLMVTRCLWNRLSACSRLISVSSTNPTITGEKQDSQVSPEEVAVCTQMITHVSGVWHHILQGLPQEQQEELICQVLQGSLMNGTDFRKQYEDFFQDSQPAIRVSWPYLLPLCGLVSYLRSRDTILLSPSKQYWKRCLQCLRMVYRIYLLHPGTIISFESPQTSDTTKQSSDAVLQVLFLLLETTLLIETSSLSMETFKGDLEFWKQLAELEQVFQSPFRDCARFSEVGLCIVNSYKVDWFRSHHGMLEAYLTYQRLFGLLNEQCYPNQS